MPRPMTKGVYDALMIDLPVPSAAARIDFGVDSEAHWRALQIAVRHGATVNDLDLALGDGPALTALVKEHGSDVVFETAYDCFNDNPEEEE